MRLSTLKTLTAAALASFAIIGALPAEASFKKGWHGKPGGPHYGHRFKHRIAFGYGFRPNGYGLGADCRAFATFRGRFFAGYRFVRLDRARGGFWYCR